jgi:hypothetical protein
MDHSPTLVRTSKANYTPRFKLDAPRPNLLLNSESPEAIIFFTLQDIPRI